MSRVAAIHLWQPGSSHDAELGHYCGCYWIKDEDDPAVNAVFAACNVGKFRDDDGTIGRAFFTADEIDARVAEAERVTECETEVSWL